MATCVSNLSTGLSIPSLYSKKKNKLLSSRFVKCVKSSESSGRDNLDDLQKASKQPQQQRRWVAPSSPIGLWDRFPSARTINQMLETMERIMEDPSSSMASYNNNNNNGASSLSSSSSSSMNMDMIYRRGRTPWEIKEQERQYKLRFDMPGMTKNDVQLFVEEKMLVIKAEKMINDKNENENDDDNDKEWPARSFGKYNSRIALPESVDLEKIRAEVKDGVLYVAIPKSLSSSKVFDIPVQ
ncbi:putative Heat shock protein [Dioscorea sansibarensis]